MSLEISGVISIEKWFRFVCCVVHRVIISCISWEIVAISCLSSRMIAGSSSCCVLAPSGIGGGAFECVVSLSSVSMAGCSLLLGGP